MDVKRFVERRVDVFWKKVGVAGRCRSKKAWWQQAEKRARERERGMNGQDGLAGLT